MADHSRVKEQLKEITERLEQGIQEVFESEKYKEYLNTMSKFYNYSFNNTMLIAMQKPDATLIAGYQAWQKKFERHVKRGEKGIRIIAPAPIVQKEEMVKLNPDTQEPMLDEHGSTIMEEVEIRIPAFKVIPVFDVSQTEGKELPELTVDELTGTVENYDIFMQALTKVAPVPIEYEEIPDGAKGYYHLEEKRIAIQEGMSEIQNTKTAIHEIAHATLHDIDLNNPELPMEERKDRKTKEVEAESIAYTVCQHYGMDTSDYSFGYVAGWSSDKELKELKSSLETIRKTSAALINAIDEKVAELQLAKAQELEQQKVSQEEIQPSPEDLLLNEEQDGFGIYQLKSGEELHYHRFESLDSLERHGLKVEKENYELIYTSPLQGGQTLDDIFEQFNLFRPEDFTGHSLSVSDIVLLHKGGANTAHYVDSIGFQEIPDFLDKENVIEQESLEGNEKAEQVHHIEAVEEQPEASLNQMTRSEIEETVLAYAQTKAEEYGYDVQVVEAKVYGSRTAGIEKEDSDLDVVIAYKGDIREEDFFTMLHEDGLTIGGMALDINPISEEKSGTMEEYLARANEYLEEKVKGAREVTSDKEKVEVVAEEPAQILTFYVAECMEFTSFGEYHENLTLEEAVRLYESIPAERMNGIKGIGFVLHKEGEESYMDHTMAILNGGIIDMDTINHVLEFRENPLVQQAVKDVMERFPNAETLDRETKARESQETEAAFDKECNELAIEIDQFEQDNYPLEYGDEVEDKEKNISTIYQALYNGDTDYIKEWMNGIIEEEDPPEDVEKATELMKRMDDLIEKRERNPLAKVEELEEANYNQIDGILNNQKPKEQDAENSQGLSIMERLERNREKVSSENPIENLSKETEKKPEREMD